MLIFGDEPLKAYGGLFSGAFGSGRAWSTTIRKTTPLILTGLSVAVAFKAGLFNIGASGQFMMGTVFSVAVGVNFEGLPAIIHLPLALLAGIVGGMFWGAIPGLLKVYTGAHEVIVTIMLNYVAALFASWTVSAGGTQGQSARSAVGRHGRTDIGNARRIPQRAAPLDIRAALSSSLGRSAGRPGCTLYLVADLQDYGRFRGAYRRSEHEGCQVCGNERIAHDCLCHDAGRWIGRVGWRNRDIGP